MNLLDQFSSYIWLSFFTIALLIALSAYSWRRRATPGVLWFAISSLFAALWATGALMEFATADVTTKIFWFKFQVAWQLPATTAVTCFVLDYAWPGRWLTRRNLIWLVIVVLLPYWGIILTDDFHHLMWR